jgi:hypothetical protein
LTENAEATLAPTIRINLDGHHYTFDFEKMELIKRYIGIFLDTADKGKNADTKRNYNFLKLAVSKRTICSRKAYKFFFDKRLDKK